MVNKQFGGREKRGMIRGANQSVLLCVFLYLFLFVVFLFGRGIACTLILLPTTINHRAKLTLWIRLDFSNFDKDHDIEF